MTKKTSVHIRRLPISGVYLGVYPHEKNEHTDVTVSISLTLKNEIPSCKDTLPETVDYVHAARLAASVACQKHYNLIETLAEAIGIKLIETFELAERVRVCVHKASGLPEGLAAATVTLSR